MTRYIHRPGECRPAPRIVLDARTFGRLVRGEPVDCIAHDGTQVAVLLADIGFARLTNLLLAAIDAATPTAPAPRR